MLLHCKAFRLHRSDSGWFLAAVKGKTLGILHHLLGRLPPLVHLMMHRNWTMFKARSYLTTYRVLLSPPGSGLCPCTQARTSSTFSSPNTTTHTARTRSHMSNLNPRGRSPWPWDTTLSMVSEPPYRSSFTFHPKHCMLIRLKDSESFLRSRIRVRYHKGIKGTVEWGDVALL